MAGEAAQIVDLMAIGDGVNGAGVARHAAGRGSSVILCEKGDLAEGASSRSGEYVHGALRYLQPHDFRLVREALIEREALLAAAPHIAWRLRLILSQSPEQRPRGLILPGLFLYDHLGGSKRLPATCAVDLTTAPEGEPIRKTFTRAFEYWDCWVDDARLVVVNAVDAARRGAQVLTRTACVSARREGDVWRATLRDAETGGAREVRARALFNAAGPRVETALGAVAGVNARRNVRLVKGSHIILKRRWTGAHGYVLQNDDKRLIFVNPYLDDLALVGATDIPFEGRPEDMASAADEVAYLLRVLNRCFDVSLTAADVIADYSGVRPLFDDGGAKGASAVTRDYEFELDGGDGHAPILSAFGGKITICRKLAERGLGRLKPFVPQMKGPWTADAPLPGGAMPGADFEAWFRAFRAARPWPPEPLARRYARACGTEARALLDGARALGDLGRRFGGLLYKRKALWVVTREWARAPEDMLTRRTRRGPFMTPAQRDAFADWMAQERQAA